MFSPGFYRRDLPGPASQLRGLARERQHIAEMSFGQHGDLGHRRRVVELGRERGHAGILDAAGDDPVECGKVRRDVEREAVLGRLAAHTDADGDNLALRPVTRRREPDTRTALYAQGRQAVVGDGTDERLLQAAYVVDHVHPIRKRHDGVADELSGAVPGDLAAPVDVDHRRSVLRAFRRLGPTPGGVHVGVLQEQHSARTYAVSHLGVDPSLLVPRPLVVDEARWRLIESQAYELHLAAHRPG